uniref:Uncharacterized protein n=1 Tax=viral metagenome TaxID=1070528 RepID=A0A6C0BII3_9ZZZZ
MSRRATRRVPQQDDDNEPNPFASRAPVQSARSLRASRGSPAGPVIPPLLSPAELAKKAIDDFRKFVAEDPVVTDYAKSFGPRAAKRVKEPKEKIGSIFLETSANPNAQEQKDKSKIDFDTLQQKQGEIYKNSKFFGTSWKDSEARETEDGDIPFVSCKEDFEVALFPVCKKLQAALTVSLKDIRDQQNAKVKAARPITDPAVLQRFDDAATSAGTYPAQKSIFKSKAPGAPRFIGAPI